MNIKVMQVEYHRNGVMGNGFHVITFIHDHVVKFGIVFEEKGCVAVMDVALLAQGIIGQPNKWRGDDFEPELRFVCENYGYPEKRYHLGNSEHFIEFQANAAGYKEAVKYRDEHPAFKRRQITEVLQMYPIRAPLGVEIEYT